GVPFKPGIDPDQKCQRGDERDDGEDRLWCDPVTKGVNQSAQIGHDALRAVLFRRVLTESGEQENVGFNSAEPNKPQCDKEKDHASGAESGEALPTLVDDHPECHGDDENEFEHAQPEYESGAEMLPALEQTESERQDKK